MARIIFVSHPFSSDPVRNAKSVLPVARAIASAGHLPFAPQLYLPQFTDESSERNLATKLCLEFLVRSDEVWVYGEPTDGMRLEQKWEIDPSWTDVLGMAAKVGMNLDALRRQLSKAPAVKAEDVQEDRDRLEAHRSKLRASRARGTKVEERGPGYMGRRKES